MSEVRIRFADKVLVDDLHENPVEQYQLRARRRNVIILVIVLAVLVFVAWRIIA